MSSLKYDTLRWDELQLKFVNFMLTYKENRCIEFWGVIFFGRG